MSPKQSKGNLFFKKEFPWQIGDKHFKKNLSGGRTWGGRGFVLHMGLMTGSSQGVRERFTNTFFSNLKTVNLEKALASP